MNYKTLLLSILIISKIKSEEENLQLIIELFRHGARRETPSLKKNLSSYPDPNTVPNDLTAVGYKAHYFLGKAIREVYKDFLPEKYNFHNVEIYASSKQRTIQSANSQIFGLFEGSGPDIENDNPEFYNPPIEDFDIVYTEKSALPSNIAFLPVINQAMDRNTLFTSEHVCPVLMDKLGSHVEKKFKDNISVFEPLYKELIQEGFLPTLYVREKEYNIVGAFKVCDLIISKTWNDPDFKVSDSLVDQCKLISLYYSFEMFSDPELRKTRTTELYKLLIDVLTLKSSGKKEDLKLLLLSGHDTNVSAFASLFFPNNDKFALNLYKKKYNQELFNKNDVKENEKGIESINFTANFIMEVFKNKGEAGNRIRIKYNNELIKIDNERSEMLLTDFMKLLENNIDKNFESNCGAFFQHPQIIDINKYFIAWLITFIILLSLVVVLYVITKNSKRKALEESLVENDEELLI